MRKQKPKVQKHLAFDSDIFERADKEAESENKSLNEWVNDTLRLRIEDIDKANSAAEQPSENPANSLRIPRELNEEGKPILTLEDADRMLRNQIIPLVRVNKGEGLGIKEVLSSLALDSKLLLEAVEYKLGLRKNPVVNFEDISKYNPLEKARLEGLRVAKERREINERAELLSELPLPQPVDGDVKAAVEAVSAVEIQAPEAPSSAPYQTNDSVRLIDESKEIPTNDDETGIPVSPADGDEGVKEDPEEEVPEDD